MADNPTSAYYTGNGTTTDRVVPCPYLSPSHIKVTVDGVATAYTFVSSSIIRISPAPAVGKTIRVYRNTPKTPIVDWADGAIILGRNMNAANLQNIYIAEEAYSYAEGIAEEAKQFALEGLSDEVDEALTVAKIALAGELDPKVAAANAAVTAAQSKVDLAAAQVTLAAAEKSAAVTAKTDAVAAKDAAITARTGIETAVGDANTLLSGFIRYYLGAKAVEPVVDNSGAALEKGALFFHTGPSKMKVWDGFAWQLAYNSYEAPPASQASDVANDSGVTGPTVKDALNTLKTDKADASVVATKANASDVTAALSSKSDAAHTHTTTAVTDITATGKSLVTAADAAAAKTVLGLQNVNNTADASKTVKAFTVSDTRAVVSQPDNVPGKSGIFEFKEVASAGNPPGPASATYAHVLTINGWDAGGSGGWPTQISFGSSLSFRQGTSATTWGAWKTLLTTGYIDTDTALAANSDTFLPSQKAVKTYIDTAAKWKGASFTVSTSAPSGGTDGDFWFERIA